MRHFNFIFLLIILVCTSVATQAQNYCTSTATSTVDTYIEMVSFGSINSTSSGCATYTNNTAQVASVFKGLTYTLSVRSGDCDGGSAFTHELRAYIDWNGDGDFFDVGEEVLTKSPRSAASTETRQIAIPANAFTGRVRLRVVATEGTASPCGSYSWGETEDYTLDISQQPEFDANMGSVRANALGMGGYTQIPFTHNPSYEFEASVASTGFDTITGVTLNASIIGAAYTQSINVGTLVPGDDTNVTTWNLFTPTAQGDYEFEVIASINENDTVPMNDTSRFAFGVSDSVLARDDSSITGGLGFNSAIGEFGHIIDVNVPDTLTSLSFYLSSPAVGTNLRAYIYKSDTASVNNGFPYGSAGRYFNPIDSSRSIVVTSSTGRWYTLLMGCENGVILDPGTYMIGVYQLNPNNMSFGYTLGVPTTTGTTFYRVSTDSAWTDLKTSVSNVADALYVIRANFGRKAVRNLFGDTAFYCNQGSTALSPNGTWSAYTWGNQSFLDSLTVSSQGVYNVTVEDANGCSFADSVQVLERNPISLANTVSNATCGNSDGSVVSVASGDNGPFNYHWSSGAMSDTASGLSGGNYSVTVTDAVGCTEAASVLVLGKNPVIGSSFTPPTCNGDADGVATVNVIEGIPSYSYAWQGGGSSSAQLTGLSAGSYTVTVTDSSNCNASITIDVVNPDSLLLSTSNSSNPSNCGANDGVARVNATGGVSPYSYFWSNSQNQKSAINLGTGTYDVTVTDGLGCVRTATVSLIDPNAPTVSGVNSSVTCSHDLGSVAVTVSGGTAPYSYFWNNNSSDSSQMNLPVGIYSVNVTDAAGCLKVTTAEVQGPAHMDVDFNISYGPAGNGDTEIDAVISGANAPYNSYSWRSLRGIFGTTIAGASSNVLSNALNGDYRIVVEDAQGCLDSAEVSINNLSVGINNASSPDQSMKVYPNPSNGKVNLSMNVEAEEAVLRVRDAQGKMVAEKVLANYRGELISIDLTGQAEGLYFVDMYANEKHYVSKVQLTK